jgi:hypothetical protein
MDIRNPPYIPRYVIPARPKAGGIGVTTVSPRNTMLPSVEELYDARARVEAKLLREKSELPGIESPRTSNKRSTNVEGAHNDMLLGSSGRKSRSSRDTQGSLSDSTTPLNVPQSDAVTTKLMFGTSGVCGPYHHSSLITSTLNDPSWFRLTKFSTACAAGYNASSPLVHQHLSNSGKEHFFGGIRPGVFPSLLSSPRQLKAQDRNDENNRVASLETHASHQASNSSVVDGSCHVHLPVLASTTQSSPGRRW